MIVIEKIDDELIKSYSDSNKMIKPVYDRIGKEINPNAVYGEAIDIIVNGQPRYDYVETDIDIEVEEEVLEEETTEEETDEVVEEVNEENVVINAQKY